MRALLTFFVVAVAGATPATLCTQLPSGTYQTRIGYNKFLTLTKVDSTVMYVSAYEAPDEEEEMDEEDKIKWNKYQRMLNSYMQVGIDSDCSLSVTDEASKEAWHRMILVLSDYMGQYVAALVSFGKYMPESDTLMIGDGIEVTRA